MIDRETFLARVRAAKEAQDQQLAQLRDRLATAAAENEDLKNALAVLGVTDDG